MTDEETTREPHPFDQLTEQEQDEIIEEINRRWREEATNR